MGTSTEINNINRFLTAFNGRWYSSVDNFLADRPNRVRGVNTDNNDFDYNKPSFDYSLTIICLFAG
jgi:hypothetical protein